MSLRIQVAPRSSPTSAQRLFHDLTINRQATGCAP
jgi:hypothetical protein